VLVSQQELKAGNPHPEPGEQVALEAQDENGHVLYRQIYTLAQSKAEAPGLALEATMVEEEWLAAEFKRGQTEPPLEGAGAKEGIDALKLAWDIIKDNRAVTDLKGASSALLNPDDMNPFNYAGGREGSSPQVYWWGYNWPIKSWKCFEIWLRVCGVYRAKGP
jgi:hypothetical protein